MAILEVRRLSKSFGGLKAVDSVDLDVEEETITGLIGPNGSGKTTLFNMISGVVPRDSGEIWFEGKRIDGLKPFEIYERGIVRSFQIPRLFWKLMVLDNMLLAVRGFSGESFIGAIFRRWRWAAEEKRLVDKALDILNILGLSDSAFKPAYQLSGGQMKLLEIGRALMADPKLLLLDEPTAGVNPKLAYSIFGKIEDIRRAYGTTFFIIEHRVETLFSHADWVYVMSNGSLIYGGKPSGVISDSRVQKAYLGDIHAT
jgi:branched-chain amino acid transport system ATP-binding protein